MGWTGLPDIDDVEPLSAADRKILEEVRGVLERHDALGRFGLTLLHSHFDLKSGEVLVETVDREARQLVTEPRLAEEMKGQLVATSWRLDAADGVPVVLTYCYRSGDFHMR